MRIQKIKCSACGETHQVEVEVPIGESRLLQFICPKTQKRIIFHSMYFDSLGILPEPFNPSRRQLRDYQMEYTEPSKPK